MKAVGWLAMAICVALAAGILLMAVWTGRLPAPQTAPESSSASAPMTTASETPAATEAAGTVAYRVVGVWQGKLAVFLPSQPQPEEVYDVEVSVLPEAEQERLEKGLTVPDQTTLAKLLEDYTS